MEKIHRACIGLLTALSSLSGPAVAEAAHCHDDAHAAAAPRPNGGRYLRSTHRYEVPGIYLVDQDGQRIALAEALQPGAPVVVNFIFTTCTTICPVMTATFSGLRRKLGKDAEDLRMVSISIDPEHDRPATLKAYANRFGAHSAWRFYTGSAADVRAVLGAFDAFAGDKSNHRPITLIRAANAREWTRIEGFASAEDLAGELREMRAEK